MSYFFVVAIGAIAALFGVASRKPNTFSVVRSATINAAPEKIFPMINDFHRWASWSPFEKLDPAMTKTFTGSDSGPGAMYGWSGNRKAGSGSMTITAVAPSTNVTIGMSFLKPFKSQSTVEFTLKPGAGGTEVTWNMTGKNLLASKVMSTFVSMDKVIGKDFAEGLANLKREAESTS
jgi:uncharacterized protein YndB with AHSA1/START domain